MHDVGAHSETVSVPEDRVAGRLRDLKPELSMSTRTRMEGTTSAPLAIGIVLRMLVGAGLASAIWSIALLLRILPGDGSDTVGLVACVGVGALFGGARAWRVLTVAAAFAGAVVAVVCLTPISETIAGH